MLPPVIFSYDEKTNFEAYSIAADDGKIDYTRFYMDDGCDQDMFPERGLYERHWNTEQKDYWGYFRRNTTGSNRFNPYGSRDQACISGTDIP
jgi:hypothetical protein